VVRGVRLLTADLNTSLKLKRTSESRGSLEFGEGGGFASDGGFNLFGRRRDMSVWTPSLSDRVQFIEVDDVMTAYELARPGRSAA
jgi:hypothetical protein